MEEAPSLEATLATVERRVGHAINATAQALAALKRARKAAKNGDIAAVKKAMAEQRELTRAAQADSSTLAQSWPYSDDDERRLFEGGAFVQEVLSTAKREDVAITEQDGVLMSYPVIVRVDAGRRAVTIDKKLFRQIRPTTLVDHLRVLQQRPVKMKPAPFLESLFRAWEYARHRQALGRLPLSDVRVDDVYAVLTVAPGGSLAYTRQEFGRDLYLLERTEVRTTKSGSRVHFSRSTGTKQAGVIVVAGEDGGRVVYSSIGFTAR